MKKYIVSFLFTRNYCIRSIGQTHEITNKLISQESFHKFQTTLPKIMNNVFTERASATLSGFSDYINKSIGNSLCSGKYMCGPVLLRTYEKLETPNNITEQSFYEACVLAWAIEMFHYYHMKLENSQDGAKIQRKSHNLLPLIEASVFKDDDTCLIRSSIYETLYRNFGDKPSYKNIINLFNTAFLNKAAGQHLDKKVSKAYNGNCDLLTMEQYENIVYNKSTYCKINLPIYLAITLIDRLNDKDCHDVHDICIDIGTLLQMKEDFLDCFGESDQIDYTGTDIEAGRCTWLAVTTLQRCTTPQRIVFNACYGSSEPAHMERIKGLYIKLKLPQIYREQKIDIKKRLEERIENLSTKDGDIFPHDIFSHYLCMIDKDTC